MAKSIYIAVFLLISISVTAQQRFQTAFEEGRGMRTPPYQTILDYYFNLSVNFKEIKLETAGPTDVRYPLQVVYYSADGVFDVRQWKSSGKIIVLINNGIHPGEPDGIDASMMFLRDAATGKLKIPDNVVLAIIPVFNIGGHLNMRPNSRANQNGPMITGFRGNAQNLDLNRDFIKADALETQSLIKLFHKLDPDVLIDNHVSNGADYQHIMTLLSTQHSKLGGAMGKYLNEKLEPQIYAEMKKHNYDLVPYVNVWGKNTPDIGWTAFLETPRFLSGFAALFHTYAFVAETHMLKPYQDRVLATYALMETIVNTASVRANDIRATRKQQRDMVAASTKLPIAWEATEASPQNIELKGYQSGYKKSEVTGFDRLYYDRSKPYTKTVPYYNTYEASAYTNMPKAYVVPQGWHDVIDRLKMNGVEMRQLPADSYYVELNAAYIASYETVDAPYEGHYLHKDIKVRYEHVRVNLRQGDYYIPAEQPAKRYLAETLDPTAPDGFFAWGFFDAILQQKEGYSDYVFEDLASQILNQDSVLKQKFYDRRKVGEFSNDSRAQLDFIYHNSEYYEPEHMRFPVYRLE